MVIFFMSHLNVEIKARCADPSFIKNYLVQNNADFKGLDQQTDTYFTVNNGRLKLREGNIENNLIFYNRGNQPGPKSSHFHLVKVEDAKGLKEVLRKSCGVKMIVRKRREIYYIDNVKFHLDEVPDLGTFVEVEAGDILANKTETELLEQCNFYLKEFGIKEEDLIAESYSDMLLKVKNTI